MAIQEKISLASQCIEMCFFNKGLFYRGIIKIPCGFVQHVKAYRVNVKFIKTVNQRVYSLGLSIYVLEQLASEKSILENRSVFLKVVFHGKAKNHVAYTIHQLVQNNASSPRTCFQGLIAKH